MYKPPMNTNRVKDMRSKFESNDLNGAAKSGPKLNNSFSYRSAKSGFLLNEDQNMCISQRENSSSELRPAQQVLSRQLSDPLNKRNIKRTPAFRLEKNPTTHKSYKSNFLESKIKIFDKRLTHDCDNNENININVANHKDIPKKAIMNDLKLTENCNFTTKEEAKNLNNAENEEVLYANLKFLYAEPIPKALRNKQNFKDGDAVNNSENIASKLVDKCTEIISKGLKSKQNSFINCDNVTNSENIHDKSTLKITDKSNLNSNDTTTRRLNFVKSSLESKAVDLDDVDPPPPVPLTDTLKSALKRPLPAGPAPRKPPRTFLHSPKGGQTPEAEHKTLEKTISQLNLNKSFTNELNSNLKKGIKDQKQAKTRRKNDPMYMLNKLENALRNNKIRLKRHSRVENTSGEESDSDLKCDPNTPPLCVPQISPNQKFNLNCLSSLDCSNTVYEKIKEPSSSFFIPCKSEEPVYAIPFQIPADRKDSLEENAGNSSSSENDKCLKRNSLYYMSSPVLSSSATVTDSPVQNVNKQAPDDPSISSEMDLSSGPASTSTIKDIISAFESKSSGANWEKSPKDRVKTLENQLRTTIDIFSKKDVCSLEGSSDNSEKGSIHEDASNGSKEDITSKFKTYARTIRVLTKPKKKSDDCHLFTCCLLVGLGGKVPYIKSKYPPNVEIPPNTEHLCFPDVGVCPMDDSYRAQCYSLVITKDTGERVYGYCRRVLPEGSRNCLPLVYCILSKHRASNLYKRILEEIESRHGLPEKLTENLLTELYTKPFPSPGDSIRIDLSQTVTREENVLNGDRDLHSFIIVNKGGYGTIKRTNECSDGTLKKSCSTPLFNNHQEPLELILTLHQDSRYKDSDIEELCNSLTTIILQKVFASLLLERKVIFVSCVLSKLSSCIEALQSILYPFSWPHTFVPVLPSMLWEIVEAPTPIICGVLSVTVINDYKIENALVVDLDEGAVLLEVGDESKILPSCLVRTWKESLAFADSAPSLLSDAFLRVFVSSCGHYRDFVMNGIFQKEGFLEYPKGKGVRRFLKWFTETTMFYSFIDSVIGNTTSYQIFDKGIQIYSSPDAALILEKMKDWKKEKGISIRFF